jgi:uncharacterized repeat protein (TIGR01451 family)
VSAIKRVGSTLVRDFARVVIGISAVAIVCAALADSAGASPPAVSWSLEAKTSGTLPGTFFPPGSPISYEALAENVGTAPAEEVTFTDTLPAGVQFKSVAFYWSQYEGGSVNFNNEESKVCSVSGQQVTCAIPAIYFLFFGPVEAGQTLRLVVEGTVSSSVAAGHVEGEFVDKALIEGDGATATAETSNRFSSQPKFGFKFKLEPTEGIEETFLGEGPGYQVYAFANKPYKTPFTQAGGHPWGLTTTVEFATEMGPKGFPVPVRDIKDGVLNLPPGLLGDPQAVPRCPLSQVTNGGELCPADTQVGYYHVHDFGGDKEYLAPIVNVTPEAGQSAEFALENTTPLDEPLLTAHLVRTTEGGVERYGFAVVSKSIPLIALTRIELTFWGVPADVSHNPMRGRVCRKASVEPLLCEGGNQAAGQAAVPFLSLPTDCAGGPESATLRADSWQEPGKVEEPGSTGEAGRYSGYVQESVPFPAVTGCDLLQFKPGTGITLEPDTKLADEPVGLGVSLKIPLNEKPGTNTTPLLRDTRVTLPEGMSVSPGVVDGIQACNATGPEGINITGPESEKIGEDGEWQLAPGHCPDASIVGSAEAITPYLPVPVKGHVYLARPGCGGAGESPCTDQDALDGNLYKLYLELGGEGELANTGIEFKVPFDTEVNPATGQLTANARELVQAPYNEVKISLNGGPRAPIATPPTCGSALTTADLTPWSAPGRIEEPGGANDGLLVTGTPDSLSSSFFEVKGCAAPTPFNPGFVAGTVTPQAGQFSSFTMNLSREDREQYVKGIQLHTPPGLLALLASVPLCPEAQANNPSAYGECTASKIGTTRVATGAGSHPFEIEGNVYLTGPYGGAPFGLSIVTHATAGPFNLGLVVVRARIDINPENSTATITTDETGPYAVPQIIFGVPLRLRRITVDIDRPGFMFNPTNCAAQQISASISGAQEAVKNVASPFAVGGCKSLAFKPKFTAATSAHTSRKNGASLDVKLSYPAGSLGNEANIARVKVDLPKRLPSRLTTLQKACPAATFAANPAQCPAASIVGIARAKTPLLPVGLAGPAYFVSHGGEAFPDLVIVLEGDGVRVDLTGTTFISKAGITSSTFKTVPDVPVGTFELYLPEGRYSALAANGNLCKSQSKLKMPTEFVAQNGAIFKQSTQIQVGGCAASKTKRGAGK